MSETKWTKGPWKRESSDDGFLLVGPRSGCIRNGKRNQWVLATIGSPEFWDDKKFRAEDLANARLIAAAPNLYAALADWLAGYDGWPRSELERRCDPATIERIEKTRAALARARGETA